jgi:hypothetical protein
MYQQHYFFLCKTPLSSESEKDVEVILQSADSESFPDVFRQYEELRSHAFNEDKLYSVVRADFIYDLVRAVDEKSAKEIAWEKAKPEIVTNLQHKFMQSGDKQAEKILKEVHDISFTA